MAHKPAIVLRPGQGPRPPEDAGPQPLAFPAHSSYKAGLPAPDLAASLTSSSRDRLDSNRVPLPQVPAPPRGPPSRPSDPHRPGPQLHRPRSSPLFPPLLHNACPPTF